MPAKQDNTSHIPFKGDAREFLINCCRVSRDSWLRQIESMSLSSPSSEYLDHLLDEYQAQADMWLECLTWLEAHGANNAVK